MSVFTNPASGAAEQARAYVAAILELLGDRDPNDVLRSTVGAIKRIVDGLSLDQLTELEALGKWSMRHVIQHLADSDLVWGFRLRMVLAHDRPTLAGYDQDLWADRLGYTVADPHQALRDFEYLRSLNLRLLSRLSDGDLDRVSVHEERGEESVRHMIRLYAGHDLLHLRQINRILLVVSQR